MKICRKHKKEFYGLRCPICTAPPVIHSADEEKLPFPGQTSAEAQAEQQSGRELREQDQIQTDDTNRNNG